MASSQIDELLQLNQKLLDSIAFKNWSTYSELCTADLTAFEPEARGQLVEGLEFHHFYFKLGGGTAAQQTTMCSPRVHMLGDTAIVAYVRLTQRMGGDGQPVTASAEETRIWHKQGSAWKHVHFHRSVPS